MPTNLAAYRIKKLRARVLARAKSPTAKINSILRRKALFARRNPARAKEYSNEMIFAQARGRVRTKNGEIKNRVLKFKYASDKATQTKVSINPRFTETKRLIHTHPLIVLKRRTRQIPSPSLMDLVVMLSSDERASLIAVPNKRNTREIAGYMVVKKTAKSTPLTNAIREKEINFMRQANQNKSNPNYWTSILNLLKEEKYNAIKENTQLFRSFGSIESKSQELARINQTQEYAQNTVSFKAGQLKEYFERGIIGEIEYGQKLAQQRKQTENSNRENTTKILQLESEISEIIESELVELSMLHTYQLLHEIGFIEKIRTKTSQNKPELEYAGFQKIKPTSPLGPNIYKRTKEREKVIEEELGLHLRLVPVKGFEVREGQFVKKQAK